MEIKERISWALQKERVLEGYQDLWGTRDCVDRAQGTWAGRRGLGWRIPPARQLSCSLKVLNLCWFDALLRSCLDPNSSQVSLSPQLSGLMFLTPHKTFRSLTLQLPIFMSQSSPEKWSECYGASVLLGKHLYLCRAEVLGSGCLQQPLLSVRPQIYPFKTLLTLTDQISQPEEIKPYPYPHPPSLLLAGKET